MNHLTDPFCILMLCLMLLLMFLMLSISILEMIKDKKRFNRLQIKNDKLLAELVALETQQQKLVTYECHCG